MKQLTEYTKNGYAFALIERTGNLAIFHGIHKASRDETWELIRIQNHDGRVIQGKEYPPAEYPPHNEQWGRLGWTFTNEDWARKTLARMTKESTPEGIATDAQ